MEKHCVVCEEDLEYGDLYVTCKNCGAHHHVHCAETYGYCVNCLELFTDCDEQKYVETERSRPKKVNNRKEQNEEVKSRENKYSEIKKKKKSGVFNLWILQNVGKKNIGEYIKKSLEVLFVISVVVLMIAFLVGIIVAAFTRSLLIVSVALIGGTITMVILIFLSLFFLRWLYAFGEITENSMILVKKMYDIDERLYNIEKQNKNENN